MDGLLLLFVDLVTFCGLLGENLVDVVVGNKRLIRPHLHLNALHRFGKHLAKRFARVLASLASSFLRVVLCALADYILGALVQALLGFRNNVIGKGPAHLLQRFSGLLGPLGKRCGINVCNRSRRASIAVCNAAKLNLVHFWNGRHLQDFQDSVGTFNHVVDGLN